MATGKHHIAAIAIAMAAFLGALVFLVANKPGEAQRPAHATVLPERLPLPEFSLVDHNGEPFTRERLRERSSLLFFGFTHCPDICPATLQQLAAARERLTAEGVLSADEMPRIVLISVDPERDTPERLRAYVSHFGAGIVGVTGEEEALRELTGALGIFHQKEAIGEDGDYTVSHSTAVLVIDRNARLQALFSEPHRPEHFALDLPLLAAR